MVGRDCKQFYHSMDSMKAQKTAQEIDELLNQFLKWILILLSLRGSPRVYSLNSDLRMPRLGISLEVLTGNKDMMQIFPHSLF